MIARLILLSLSVFVSCAGQTFDVASVRLSQFQSADGEGNGLESIQVSPDGLAMRGVTLRACISWAYNVQDSQISGTLGTDRFDITAKAVTAVPSADLRLMLRALLADRFQLQLHRDDKEVTSLAIVVAKGGSKLRASQEDGPGALRPAGAAMVAQHATIAEFAGTLAGPLRMPVVDKTGLAGRYDFTVDLSSYLANTKPGEPPDMTGIVSAAIRDQLGLSLELRKERAEILVIDHAEKRPSGN